MEGAEFTTPGGITAQLIHVGTRIDQASAYSGKLALYKRNSGLW
jgi:hypothetical protein